MGVDTTNSPPPPQRPARAHCDPGHAGPGDPIARVLGRPGSSALPTPRTSPAATTLSAFTAWTAPTAPPTLTAAAAPTVPATPTGFPAFSAFEGPLRRRDPPALIAV